MMAKIQDIMVTIGADITKLTEGMNKAGKTLQQTGDKMKSVGMSMTAGITVPLVAIGTAAGASADAIQKAMREIRIGTGATGEELEQMGETFKSVYADVPASADQVATAIADLKTRLGLSGEALEEMSVQMLNLARITGTDVGNVIRDTTRVFGDWNVATEDQADTLDYLFKVAQATGIQVDKLANSLVQYGAPLRQMGFDMETSAALMGKWEQEGVNMELVLGSLRIALGNMAREGITDANEALQEMIRRVSDAGSASEANAIAIEMFGARAGPDMAAAIREGRFELGNLAEDLKASTESINTAAYETMTFGEKMTLLKNKTTLAIEPLGTALLNAFDKLMPSIEKIIGFVTKLIEGFTNLPEPVQTTVIVLTGLAAAAGPLLMIGGQMIKTFGVLTSTFSGVVPVIGKVAGSIPAIGAAFTGLGKTLMTFMAAAGPWALAIGGIVAAVALIIKYWEPISEFFGKLWDGIVNVATKAWDGLKNFFAANWEAIKLAAEKIWGGIKDFFSGLWDGIKNAASQQWETIKLGFSTIWNGIVDMGKNIWNGLKDFFSGLWDSIGSTMKSAWESIGNFFGGIWDWMTGKSKDSAKEIKDDFQDLSDDLVGHSIVPDMAKKIVGTFHDMESDIARSMKSGMKDSLDEAKWGLAEMSKMFKPLNTTFAPQMVGHGYTPIHIDQINLPNVRKPDDFAEELVKEVVRRTGRQF